MQLQIKKFTWENIHRKMMDHHNLLIATKIEKKKKKIIWSKYKLFFQDQKRISYTKNGF